MIKYASEGAARWRRVPTPLKIVAAFSFLIGLGSFFVRLYMTQRARPDGKVVNNAGHLRHLIAQYQVEFIMNTFPNVCNTTATCDFSKTYKPVKDANFYLDWMLRVLAGLSGTRDLAEEGIPVASKRVHAALEEILQNITTFNRTWFGRRNVPGPLLSQKVSELTELLDFTDRHVNNVCQDVASTHTAEIFHFFVASGCIGLINAILLMLLSLREHIGTTSKQRAEIDAQTLEIEIQQDELQAAAEGSIRILNHFCDCLLQLGDQLEIVEPSRRFAALLLYTDDRRLEGRSLSDWLVSEQDESRLLQSIDRCHVETEFLEMMRIELRDSTGRVFPVSAYLTSCPPNRGKTRLLVGFAEQEERATLDCVNVPPACGVSAQTFAGGNESDRTSEDSWMNISRTLSRCNEGLSVWLDLGYDGLPVLKTSDEFAALHGPISEGFRFHSLLMGRESKTFFKWLMSEMRPIIDAQMGLPPQGATSNGRALKTRFFFGAEASNALCLVDLEKSAKALAKVERKQGPDQQSMPVRVKFRITTCDAQPSARSSPRSAAAILPL